MGCVGTGEIGLQTDVPFATRANSLPGFPQNPHHHHQLPWKQASLVESRQYPETKICCNNGNLLTRALRGLVFRARAEERGAGEGASSQ
jgi:hypothetical protein